MNWILLTILAFLSSVALYLSVRLAKNYKLPASVLNFSMFALPSVFLALFILISKETSFDITIKELIIILTIGFFFSYFGNLLSIKGMQAASNPGISLMIQKSYGALNLFLAPIFYDAEITTKGLIGTALIITFGLVLSYEKGKKIFGKDNRWLIYTFGAFFAFSFLTLTAKYLFIHDLNVFTYLFYLMSFVSIFSLIQIRINKEKISNSISGLFILGIIGIFAFSLNIFLYLAIDKAPNVGYVNAANAASIAALSIAAWIFFKDNLSIQKLIGIFGIFAGLLLIFLS